MKILLCFLVILASVKECNQKKAEASPTSETNSESAISDTKHQVMTISYKANGRGFYEKVWMEEDSLKFTNDRYEKVVVSKIIPNVEKEALIALLNVVDLKKIPQLEAPTKAYEYDGAAMATLEISNGKSNYKTKTFDHENPPEAIRPLVEKLLSLKAMLFKN